MSAAVIPFTGQWRGAIPEPEPRNVADGLALYDAHMIRKAKQDNDDWTARLLLAILSTLDAKQLWQIEFRLLGKENLGDTSAAQALALVQLAVGDKGHRDRIRQALDHLNASEFA